MFKKIFVCLTVLISVGLCANPLQCYYCNNLLNPHCDDPFNSTNIKLINCSSITYDYANYRVGSVGLEFHQGSLLQRAPQDAQFECFMYKKQLLHNQTEVMRSCKIKDGGDFCGVVTQAAGAHYNVTKCFTCESDGCNSATVAKTSIVAAIFVMVALFLD